MSTQTLSLHEKIDRMLNMVKCNKKIRATAHKDCNYADIDKQKAKNVLCNLSYIITVVEEE